MHLDFRAHSMATHIYITWIHTTDDDYNYLPTEKRRHVLKPYNDNIIMVRGRDFSGGGVGGGRRLVVVDVDLGALYYY